MKNLGVKLSFIILTILMLFVLISCSKNKEYNYTYKGENDFWMAEYKIYTTVRSTKNNNKADKEYEIKDKLIVTYQGKLEELSSIKHLEITYDGSILGGGLSGDYDDENRIASKTFTLSGGSKGNSAPDKNDVITVNINMDGVIQKIELTYVK